MLPWNWKYPGLECVENVRLVSVLDLICQILMILTKSPVKYPDTMWLLGTILKRSVL